MITDVLTSQDKAIAKRLGLPEVAIWIRKREAIHFIKSRTPEQMAELDRQYEIFKSQLANPAYLGKSIENLVNKELSVYMLVFEKAEETFNIVHNTMKKAGLA